MGSIQQEEGIAKSNPMLLGFGAVIYLSNLIWYGYPCLQLLGNEPSEMAYKAVNFFGSKLNVFSTPYITLVFALGMILMYAWAHRRPKTTNYVPPKMMRWIIPQLVRLGLHPEFEYKETSDKNGKMCLEKKRERIEGQAALSLGIFLVLVSVLPIVLVGTDSMLYILAFLLYFATSLMGILYSLLGADLIHSMNKDFELDDSDSNNDLQESFLQCQTKIEDEYSVNWRTEFKYQGKIMKGWINLVNPFRATQVIGTPGSGKSFAVINEVIRQHLAKGFCMYCYDFKFPDLSTIVYNHMLWHQEEFRKKYGKNPKFCVINFDDPRKSYRCNPIDANFMHEITDAYDSAYTIMLNLNKSWAQKQGDFFVESPINYLTSCIWYLRNVEGGKYCTLPHVVELVNSSYTDCIPLMSVYPELNNYMAAFFEAWEGGAQDQLQGQIASVRIPLSRISSPALYWVMTGNDFTLDLNNPEEPKVLCVGNNPEKKDIYATALGLYNGRIVKIINKKHKHKITLIIDELPTMYFRGLDNLIATARSNKVAVVLGYQDFSQLKRDYGDKEATAIINTIGNTFAGLVTGETAKTLEGQFGRNKQKRKSVSQSDSGESVSISEQNDLIIPASKISTLTQGNFVGTVSDNFGQEIQEKRFFAKILINGKEIKEEESLYRPLPTMYSFDTPNVALAIREKIIDFLSDPDNYMADVLLRVNDMPCMADIREFPNDKSIDVKKFINMVFTPDGAKKPRMAGYLKKEAAKYKKALMIHDGELQSVIARMHSERYENNPSEELDRIKKELLSSIGKFRNESMKEWFDAESSPIADKVPYKGKTLDEHLKEYKRYVESLDRKAYPEDVMDQTKKYVTFMQHLFERFISLESKMQQIRDDKMKSVLDKNSDKVRSDIKDLIKRQLQNLYFEHHDDLWTRRLKANKLKEIDELVRIGLEEEAERLMSEQE
jgi:hypothetical protein